MVDPFSKTRYRVAQHWTFHNQTPEASDIIVILGVEDHPTQGIICLVHYEFNPPLQIHDCGYMSGGQFWVTQDALDRSVVELVAEKGPLPQGLGTTGEFQFGPDYWDWRPYPMAVERTVGDLVRERTEEHKRQWQEQASRPPYQEPPVELLGLWSLIAYDAADRFRELLQQQPSIANSPLPRDESDNYCYSGPEYDECYPLMLATELGRLEVAKVLLEFGANPAQRNSHGDTALHFAGRCSDGFEEAAEITRLLCERGIDSDARNAQGKTPLTCCYCAGEIAKVLIQFGATPTLNHAIRLRMIDWARRELRENPDAVRNTVFPGEVLDDIGFLIMNEAQRRHGREFRLRRGESPSEGEDGWPDQMAYSDLMSYRMANDGSYIDDGILEKWRRHAEIEGELFLEYKDLLDMALARGADPNAGTALHYAVQRFDTSLAEWLLANGGDPNRDVKAGIANYLLDFAPTQRMVRLLHRYGAKDNPYTKTTDQWTEQLKRLTDRLKQQFT
jgi:hypothetical protein